MSNCPMCGAKIDGGNFCAQCGASLSAPTNSMTTPPSDANEENPFAFGTQSTVNASYAHVSEIPHSLFEAFRICFREKYSKTQGRACRSEFWYFFLFNILVGFFVFILSIVMDVERAAYAPGVVALVWVAPFFLAFVYFLAVLIPSVCVFVRRLHDVGLSGWWTLFTFIPYICGMTILLLGLLPVKDSTTITTTSGTLMLFFALRPGVKGPNKYGPQPGSQN